MSEFTRNVNQRARVLGLEFTDTALDLIEELAEEHAASVLETEREAIQVEFYDLGHAEGYALRDGDYAALAVELKETEAELAIAEGLILVLYAELAKTEDALVDTSSAIRE